MRTLTNPELAFLAMLGHGELTRRALELYAQQTYLFTKMFCPHLNLMWDAYVKTLKANKQQYGLNLPPAVIAAGISEVVQADKTLPEELRDKCDDILLKLQASDYPDLPTGRRLVSNLVKLEANRKLKAQIDANEDLMALQQSIDSSKRVMTSLESDGDDEEEEEELPAVVRPFKDIERLARKVILVPTGINWLDDVTSGGGRAGEMWLILGPSGGGKCHSPETEVLMYSGELRAIKDVHVGEQLMGPDSKPRTVISTTTGTDQMYRIKMNKGDSYICNGAHMMSLVVVNAEGMLYKGHKYKQGELVDVSVDEYQQMSRTQKSKLKHTRARIDFAQRAEPDLDPYFVGLYLGDGHLNVACITTGDQVVVDYCRELCTKLGWSCKIEPEKNENAWRIRLSNPDEWHLRRGLSAFERIKASTHLDGRKRILDQYKYASTENRLKLLAGLLDSDGYNHNNSFEIVQKSKELAMDIAFVARSLGYLVSVRRCRKTCTNTGATGTYYRMSISGNFKDLPMRVERKIAHQPEGVGHITTGFRIEPIGEGPYAGVELDGDGRYLLGDFTITHNSTITAQYASAQALMADDTLWVTYEQSIEGDLAERMIANITDTSLDEIRDVGFANLDKSIQDKFWSAVSGVDDHLVTLDMTVRKCDPTDPEDYGGIHSIDLELQKLKKEGYHPKTVIIDWFGFMMSTIAENLGLDLDRCYRFKAQEELRKAMKWAKKEKVLLIFMHQLNIEASEKRPTYLAKSTEAQDMKSMRNYFTLVMVLGVRDDNDVCWFHSPKARRSARVKRTLQLIGDRQRFIKVDGWMPNRDGNFYKPGADGSTPADFRGKAESYSRELE